jgi:hypothetical protein
VRPEDERWTLEHLGGSPCSSTLRPLWKFNLIIRNATSTHHHKHHNKIPKTTKQSVGTDSCPTHIEGEEEEIQIPIPSAHELGKLGEGEQARLKLR